MRREETLALLLIFSLVPVLAGCDSKVKDLTPEELGALGSEIYSEPGRVDEILEKAGLSREEFDEAVRQVSSDSELAGRYRESFEGQLAAR
ncbi:MAG: hypothetical protein ACRD1R_18565 [Acidobacteriota bacterium]